MLFTNWASGLRYFSCFNNNNTNKKDFAFFSPHLPSGFLIDEPSHLNRVLEIALKYTTTSWNIFVKESYLLKFWS